MSAKASSVLFVAFIVVLFVMVISVSAQDSGRDDEDDDGGSPPPTATPYPCIPWPYCNWRPTATPVPTATPIPTATPYESCWRPGPQCTYPTNTPRPATVTPRPTATAIPPTDTPRPTKPPPTQRPVIDCRSADVCPPTDTPRPATATPIPDYDDPTPTPTPLPTLPPPDDVRVTAYTSHSVTLNWGRVPGSAAYKVEQKAKGVSSWSIWHHGRHQLPGERAGVLQDLLLPRPHQGQREQLLALLRHRVLVNIANDAVVRW